VARFFFHFQGPDGLEPDDLGLDLPGPGAAFKEARRAAPGILGELVAQGHDPTICGFKIANSAGRVVLEVPFLELIGGETRSRSFAPRRAVARSVGPGPRTRKGGRTAAEAVYRQLFETMPWPVAVLTPQLQIVGANSAFFDATSSRPEQVLDRYVFEAFPENRHDAKTTDARSIAASFDRAMTLRKRDVLPTIRYDLQSPDGVWRKRYWRPENWPIVDDNGSVVALIAHIKDVTTEMLAERRPETLGEPAGRSFRPSE
jgi:PAS domain S-box-containing protein